MKIVHDSLLAAAFLGLVMAPTLGAAETTFVASAESQTASAGGMTLSYQGINLELDVKLENFRYNAELAFGDLGGLWSSSLSHEVSYLFGGFAGPKIVFVNANLDGYESGSTAAGLTASFDLSGTTIYGDVLSDANNFGDNVTVLVGTTLAAGDKVSLYTEYGIDTAMPSSSLFTLGGSYTVTDGSEVVSKISFADTGTGATGTAVSVGYGISF